MLLVATKWLPVGYVDRSLGWMEVCGTNAPNCTNDQQQNLKMLRNFMNNSGIIAKHKKTLFVLFHLTSS